MNTEHPIILLLEDCEVTGLLVERTVLRGLPHSRLLWTRRVDEATRRAKDLDVDLFLVDVGLPDGSGLDFLWEMSTTHPTARAIVMTASQLPEYQVSSAALGAVCFLRKPLDLDVLVKQMCSALNAEDTSSPSDFRATLKNVTPVDVLQLKCLSNADTVLEFRSGSLNGRIHIHEGEVVHAETGGLRGEEAALDILAWKGGILSECEAVREVKRTIYDNWQSLVMKAAQRMDEGAFAAA